MYFSSSIGISNWWSYSSSTAVYMVIQVVTSLILSMYVVILVLESFGVIELLIENNVGTHHVRYLHANICSVVFMLLLVHIGKSFWIGSYLNGNLWKSGSVLLILAIGAAFLSYVLPWGNISLWGATVITNLLSVVPYSEVVLMNVWASFTICDATLSRFFSLHFLVPLLLVGVILIHLILLHEYVSSSSVNSNFLIIEFSILLNNDILLWTAFIVLLSLMITVPQYFIDADNWSEANFLVTPDHINPEWYFLFAYAILRCVPDNVFSVLGLVFSLVIVLILGLGNSLTFVVVCYLSFIILTWLSGLEVTNYYTVGSQYCSLIYFGSMI